MAQKIDGFTAICRLLTADGFSDIYPVHECFNFIRWPGQEVKWSPVHLKSSRITFQNAGAVAFRIKRDKRKLCPLRVGIGVVNFPDVRRNKRANIRAVGVNKSNNEWRPLEIIRECNALTILVNKLK